MSLWGKYISEEDHTNAMAKKIESLEAQLREANKVIEFYHTWCRDDLHCDKICGEPTDKRAREYISKYQESQAMTQEKKDEILD